MKKIVFAVSAAAFALTACGGGGGGKAALVKECVAGGESEKTCNCVADKLQADLDSKSFGTLTKAMAAGEDKGEEMIMALPAEEQTKIMTALMGAGFACAMGGE